MNQAQPSYVHVEIQDLKQTVTECLSYYGVSNNDAEIVADVLVASDLRGIESHGVARLSSYYLKGLKQGRINPQPEIKTLSKYGSIFTMDGDNGLGHPTCHRAMQKCIDLAKDSGIAIGGIRNSNHFGIAGYYSMMASEENLIGICLTNSQPLVLPTYGRTPVLGTNPISVSIPTGKRPDFVLDMATSVVPIGRIEVHNRKGESVPADWGADAGGTPTEEPNEIIQEGGLFPLGGTAESSGYKGYDLAAIVDILSGVLTGANFLTSVSSGTDSDAAQVGHFVAAFRPDAMMDMQKFLRRMDEFIDQLKNSPKAQNCDEIYVAGEKEYYHCNQNIDKGIPILENVYEEIMKTCNDLNIEIPETIPN